MKILAIDWTAFLGFLEPWQELSRPARELLLEAKPKAVLEQRPLGAELATLLEGGFLTAFTDGKRVGKRVRLSDAFHESHKVLRAMQRHPLLERSDDRALREYLGEHFTNEEREALVGLQNVSRGRVLSPDVQLLATVSSARHVRGFLEARDARAWEEERLPSANRWSSDRAWTQTRPLLAKKDAAKDLARLIERLAADPRPIPFRALGDLEPRRERLAAALHAGLRYLLCFATLDAELLPVLMLWPSVTKRLHRVPQPPPSTAAPVETFSAVRAVEDLVQLLVRAAEPLRLQRNRQTLFATAWRELERGLLPLPHWLMDSKLFPEHESDRRIRAAQGLAEELGFTEQRGEPGRDLLLATSAAGWDWLDRTPRERLHTVLEIVRYLPEPSAKTDHGGDGEKRRGEDLSRFFGELGEFLDELERQDGLDAQIDRDEDDDLDHDDFEAGDDPEADSEDVLELVPFSPHATRWRAFSDYSLFRHPLGGRLRRAAIRAYGTLEMGKTVLFGEFLRHHGEASNPLLELDDPQRYGFGTPWSPPTEENLEEEWIQGLCRVLHGILLPYGGVVAGITNKSGLTIEVTSIGRYLLGLAPEFSLEEPDSTAKPVRVQPDFEVVFVASHPSLEAAISRVAERRGRGVGVLFRITHDSIVSAAQAGLSLDDVLATLSRGSSTPIPANVEHEIRGWFQRFRRLALEPAHLLRCPDAATASRVLAAVGAGKLEPLSETVFALLDPTQKSSIVRQCRKAGLFLVNRGQETPSARGARRTRSGRR